MVTSCCNVTTWLVSYFYGTFYFGNRMDGQFDSSAAFKHLASRVGFFCKDAENGSKKLAPSCFLKFLHLPEGLLFNNSIQLNNACVGITCNLSRVLHLQHRVECPVFNLNILVWVRFLSSTCMGPISIINLNGSDFYFQLV